jgi:transcriptional regulator with XRE-family HTH domain
MIHVRDLAREDRVPPEPSAFAARLEHLFANVHPPSRGPYSIEEVAHGTGLSARYVTNLRRGVQANPTYRAIASLAAHFGVPPAYFFDNGAATDDMATLARLRDPAVRRIVDQALQLSPAGLLAAADVVALLVRMEDQAT